VPAEGGVTLGWVADHLLLPKSSASVLVKDLERRGFVKRRRDLDDERRLAIVLTAKGRRRVEADTVLEPRRLAAALQELPERERRSLLRSLDRLAAAAESSGPG
jgi:MarR family transcriptional regulator, organic hydroperoxide resistance regulator